jgi:HEAT repeat protein
MEILVPGQFRGSAMMVLAVRGRLSDPMPPPVTGNLTEMLEDQAEYLRRAKAALKSPYTRDILDGAVAASMLGPDGEDLIELFADILADCHDIDIWTVIEPVEGVTLESTLFMIEVDLLIAMKEIGSPLGLPLARRALSDHDDGLHTFALDAIKSIGPAATDAVPDLLKYIQTAEPTGLPSDHFEFRRSLRRDACETLGMIGSPEALSSLRSVAHENVPTDIRDAAIKAIDSF